MKLRIADGFFHINADFLNLPEKGRVAMLRQVADLNLNKLLLPRFVKNGEKPVHTHPGYTSPHPVRRLQCG